MSAALLDDRCPAMCLAVQSMALARHLMNQEKVPEHTRGQFDRAWADYANEVQAFDTPYADFPGVALMANVIGCMDTLPRERGISQELGRALDGAAGLVIKSARSVNAPPVADPFQEALDLK